MGGPGSAGDLMALWGIWRRGPQRARQECLGSWFGRLTVGAQGWQDGEGWATATVKLDRGWMRWILSVKRAGFKPRKVGMMDGTRRHDL